MKNLIFQNIWFEIHSISNEIQGFRSKYLVFHLKYYLFRKYVTIVFHSLLSNKKSHYIPFECVKIRNRKNSLFGLFSRSDIYEINIKKLKVSMLKHDYMKWHTRKTNRFGFLSLLLYVFPPEWDQTALTFKILELKIFTFIC